MNRSDSRNKAGTCHVSKRLLRTLLTGALLVPLIGQAKSASFRVIFNQYLSWYQTWVGDYAGARSSFSIMQAAAKDDAPSPLQGTDWHAESATNAIARLAKDRKAVFFNENHSYPLTRTLTVLMLAALREEGFDTFAAETLYQSDMPDLARRGYATSATGFYTEEPVYAEMVREALRLGYRVIAYEALSDAIGDAREAEQARNLAHDVYTEHPDARLIVNAGYAHIQEQGKYLGGMAMAQHFSQITKIDPLTIEQTMMIPHEKIASDHPWYREVMAKLAPKQPMVFVNSSGSAWSLKQAYDLSVFFPEESLQRVPGRHARVIPDQRSHVRSRLPLPGRSTLRRPTRQGHSGRPLRHRVQRTYRRLR